MNPGNLRKFLLQALLQMGGTPMPQEALTAASEAAFAPRPLLSDIDAARRSLEKDGFILGTRDEVDGSVTWTLTVKGEHAAKR